MSEKRKRAHVVYGTRTGIRRTSGCAAAGRGGGNRKLSFTVEEAIESASRGRRRGWEGPAPNSQAALYLLTADSRLWAASRPAVSKTGIDFGSLHPKDISTEAYVLYRAAQDIVEGTRYIGAAELVDRKLVSGRMFRLICRAMELARMNQ